MAIDATVGQTFDHSGAIPFTIPPCVDREGISYT